MGGGMSYKSGNSAIVPVRFLLSIKISWVLRIALSSGINFEYASLVATRIK